MFIVSRHHFSHLSFGGENRYFHSPALPVVIFVSFFGRPGSVVCEQLPISTASLSSTKVGMIDSAAYFGDSPAYRREYKPYLPVYSAVSLQGTAAYALILHDDAAKEEQVAMHISTSSFLLYIRMQSSVLSEPASCRDSILPAAVKYQRSEDMRDMAKSLQFADSTLLRRMWEVCPVCVCDVLLRCALRSAFAAHNHSLYFSALSTLTPSVPKRTPKMLTLPTPSCCP